MRMATFTSTKDLAATAVWATKDADRMSHWELAVCTQAWSSTSLCTQLVKQTSGHHVGNFFNDFFKLYSCRVLARAVSTESGQLPEH